MDAEDIPEDYRALSSPSPFTVASGTDPDAELGEIEGAVSNASKASTPVCGVVPEVRGQDRRGETSAPPDIGVGAQSAGAVRTTGRSADGAGDGLFRIFSVLLSPEVFFLSLSLSFFLSLSLSLSLSKGNILKVIF